MNTCMGNGDEQKGEAQEDKSTGRWRELRDDDNQEPDDTLTKGKHCESRVW